MKNRTRYAQLSRNIQTPGVPSVLGGKWTPANDDALAWYDPRMLASVWQDTAGTTPAGDGDTVQRIDDQHGNGYPLLAGGGCVYAANGINGAAALSFNGSSHYLLADGIATLLSGDDKPFSCVMTFKLDSVAVAHTFFALASSAGSTPYHRLAATATPEYSSVRQPGGISRVAGTPDTNAHVLSYVFTGTTESIWIDGINILDNTAQNTDAIVTDQWTIGVLRRNTLATYFAGKIGRIAVWNTAINVTIRTNAEIWAS